jgi:hypothetical protein
VQPCVAWSKGYATAPDNRERFKPALPQGNYL